MKPLKQILSFSLTTWIFASITHDAMAQGCILIRTVPGPTLGQGSAYMQEEEFRLNLSSRILTAEKHFNLDEEQKIRELLSNNVTNIQRQYDASLTYAFTDRFNLTLSVPYIHSSWSIDVRPGFFTGDPNTPVNGTDEIHLLGKGLGDITLTGRYWVWDTEDSPDENLSIGFGVKAPTGDSDQTVLETDFAGNNLAERPVDTSVQRGTGGWGILFDLLAFKQIEESTLTLQASYLAEPRDTNQTPSIINTLGIAPTAANANLLFNSVPDSYFLRFGILHPVGPEGLALSAAYRVEGSPRDDLFGLENGFRRPGYETYFEPGIQYATGDHVFTLNVPIAHQRFRALNSSPNPVTGAFDRGDATFPDHVVLLGYNYKFGGKDPEDCPPGEEAHE